MYNFGAENHLGLLLLISSHWLQALALTSLAVQKERRKKGKKKEAK